MKVPSIDQSQGQQTGSLAPLLPAGFIHGEQGTLMPVYHPEALEQYMSTTRPESSSFQHSQPSSYPSQGPLYPMTTLSTQGLQANQGSVQSGINLGWVPGPPPSVFSALSYQQSDSTTVPFASIRQPTPAASRGGYSGKSGGQSNLPSTRRPQRRDHQQSFNANRNSHNRALPNRYSRGGGMLHSPNAGQAVRQPLATPPQFPSLAGDWNQWGTGR
jgi:hypothetical protein